MNSYTVTDNITPFMRKLAQYSRGMGNQALNKAGAKIQKHMKTKVKAFGTHKGGVGFNKKGYRIIDYNKNKKTYSRESTRTGRRLPHGMQDMVKFRLYPNSSVLLVGWINTKSFTSLAFNGGVSRPYRRVKGSNSKAIADKMAKGGWTTIEEEAELSGISVRRQKGIYKASGWGNVIRKGGVMRKSYRFMSFSQYLSIAESVAKKEFILATTQFKKAA